jgi:tetratricopeptide (TPR) repeat protein
MKKGIWYILAFTIIYLLGSCSTQKNTRASRFYHAFNSRYNIYYNGKTSYDNSLLSMIEGYKESYSEMIYMYPISAQPKDKQQTGGPFDRAIEKGNKAIKLHSIKAKPPKKSGWRNDSKQRSWQEQEEYNPFLKKCWMMIGESQFYNADFLQASATFSYIARHYKEDEDLVAQARLWQARSYSEMGWFYESEDILGKLNTNGIPKKELNQYAAVYADYLIKNKQYDDAISYFKTAIKTEKNHRQKTRMKYLLGQIYEELGQNNLAYKMFGQVANSNPPYELEFASRIRQTEVYCGSNYQQVIKMLRGMVRSDKNKDMLDQVYYAMGNIYLNRLDTVNAIPNYQMGIDKSTKNGLDKAICQIKLGDIYFTMHDYVKAQPCFSGALSGLQKTHKDYDRVSKLSAILDELVVHVQAVHLQDSLQTLAKMPEAERNAVIDKIIEKVKKDEELAKKEAAKEAYLAKQESQGTGINRPGTEVSTGAVTAGSTGGFYFYNAQAVAQGKSQFQRKWGRRTLEDDWRRHDKKMTTFNETGDNATADTTKVAGAEAGAAVDSTSTEAGLPKVASDDPKTREFYIQQLPLTPEDVDASNLIIEDALYNEAMIYKDKLEDIPLSIEAFEELERRFPDTKHLLESYYQSYLMALKSKNTTLATEFKDKLTKAFPKSDYAVAIADPNYEYNIRMMDVVQDSIYQATYNSYLKSDTSAVRKNYQTVNDKYPLAKLMPKYMFLNALTYVQAGDVVGFKNALKALVDKYPKADVTELASEMLKGVLRGRQLMQGGITSMTWNLRFGGEADLAADSARQFKAEPKTPYRMLMMYPTGSIDQNQLLFAVAAYNFANFMVRDFDLSFETSGPMTMLVISGFFNFDEITQYYKRIYAKDGYATALDKNVAILPISDDNYETLMHGKTLDEYITFFNENFGKDLPELAARWKARMDEEKAKAEEPQLPEVSDQEEESIEPQAPAKQAPAEEKALQKEAPKAEAPKEETKPAEQPKTEKTKAKQKPTRSVRHNNQQTENAEVQTAKAPTVQTTPGNKQLADTIAAARQKTIVLDTTTIQPSISEKNVGVAVKDTVPVSEETIFIPTPVEKPKNLTVKEIEEIHKQQDAEAAAAKAKAKEESKAAGRKKQEDLQKQQAEEQQQQPSDQQQPSTEAQPAPTLSREELLKKQKAEDEAVLKAKAEQEKQLAQDRKAKMKQVEADRKAKLKAQNELRKQKEKEYKAKLKAKEQERKEKERANKEKLKAKEKAHEEALKAKEVERKARAKQV